MRKKFAPVPAAELDPAAIRKVHTKQRGDTWSFYYEKAKIDGKRQKEEKGGFSDAASALSAGVLSYSLYSRGGAIATKNTGISLSDYLDIWYDRTHLRARNNTLEMREKNIRLHIKPALGSYRLTSLSPEVIDSWVISKRRDGYAYETVERYLNTLSTALDYAIYPMRFLRDNPCRFITVPGDEVSPVTTTSPRRRLEDNELKIIFKRYPFGSSYYMPYAIGLYFSARIGESLGASWDACDLDRCVLSISCQLQRITKKGFHGFHYICDVKTESSHRQLGFDRDVVLPLLRRWKSQQAANELAYGQDYCYNYLIPEEDPEGRIVQRIVSLEKRFPAPGPRIDLICTQENGRYVKIPSIAYTFGIIRKLGVPGFNFHCLRHTGLTMLGEGHLTQKAIMARGGHSDYDVSLSYIDNDRILQDESVSIITQKVCSILRPTFPSGMQDAEWTQQNLPSGMRDTNGMQILPNGRQAGCKSK